MLIFDALGYCFRDRRWLSKSLTTTFSYLLLFPPFGYATLITQYVSRGDDQGLPEHNLGTELVYGIGIFLGWLVYQIPTWIILGLIGRQVSFSLQNVTNLSAMTAAIGSQWLVNLVISQFFGFFFWVGFVLWAATGKISSFVNLVKINDTIWQYYPTLLGNYLQLTVGLFVWYFIVTLSAVTICLPFIFLGFYLFIYGYITGRTAKAIGLRAAAEGELSDFTGDI